MTRRSLALLIALSVAAAPAGAQFGIMKKVQDKAAKAAMKKAGLGPSYKPPTYTEDLLEITPERVEKLLIGLRAESTFAITIARRQKDYARQHKAEEAKYVEARRKYDADMQAWTAKKAAAQQQMMSGVAQSQARSACIREANGGSLMPSWMTPEMMEKFGNMTEAQQRAWGAKAQYYGQKGKAAHERGDDRTANMWIDSLSAFTGIPKADLMKSFAAGEKIEKCGAGGDMNAMKANMATMTDMSDMPVEPKPPSNGDIGDKASQEMNAAGAKAAGLSLRQWDIMRERVVALMDIGEPGMGTTLPFSEAEVKAVTSRKGDIAVYSEYLGGNAPSWVWNSGQ